MSKLDDYYRLFDIFKDKLTDAQKEVLGQLEDQIIADEVLPAISESVAPVLSSLRRHLTLVVDYDPVDGITVKTTRGEVVVKERTAKRYEIPSSSKVVKVATPSGMQKTLVGWRHENKFSSLHLTCVFLNNLRMFNIYQPD